MKLIPLDRSWQPGHSAALFTRILTLDVTSYYQY